MREDLNGSLAVLAQSRTAELFGEPPANFKEICKRNQYYADVAARIQRVTEQLLLGMTRRFD